MLKMQRTMWLQNWAPNTVGTSGFWRYYSVRLDDMTNVSELTNLFDTYRLAAYKITFRPRYDNFSGNDTTDTVLPGVINQSGTMLHIVKDPWSTVTPTGTYSSANLNTFLEQGNKVKTYSGNKPVSVYIRGPTINNVVEGPFNVQRIRSPWLNTNGGGTAIYHNGFHVFAQDVNLTGVFGQSWDVFVTYYLMVKNLK